MTDKSPASRFTRQGMDRVRDRRSGANFLDERVAGPGLKWENGQLALNLSSRTFLRVNGSNELEGVAHPPLEIVSGSPYGLSMQQSASVQQSASGALTTDGSTTPYTPSKRRNWSTGVPSDVSAALDYLVARVTAQDLEIANMNSYGLQVSRGLISGVAGVNKFGFNPDVDTAAPEDVWYGGGLYPFQSSAQSLEVVSADADDDDGDTGARTLEVTVVDGDYNHVVETVTMNGTSAVSMTATGIAVIRARVTSAGSSETNEGEISVRVAGGGTVLASIEAEQGQTQIGCYVVPAGKTAYLYDLRVSVIRNNTATATFSLYVMPYGEAWQIKQVLTARTSAASNAEQRFDTPLAIAEKSLIRVEVETTNSNTEAACTFQMYLVDA